MEFGSAILSELWGLETTRRCRGVRSQARGGGREVRARRRGAGLGPFFAGEKFSLVDAVFAPIFRYFDVFDELIDLSIFAETPKVRAWRTELAKRTAFGNAVGADYPQLLHAFLVRHNAHMLKLAA